MWTVDGTGAEGCSELSFLAQLTGHITPGNYPCGLDWPFPRTLRGFVSTSEHGGRELAPLLAASSLSPKGPCAKGLVVRQVSSGVYVSGWGVSL